VLDRHLKTLDEPDTRRWKNWPSWGASSKSDKGAEGRVIISKARTLFGRDDDRFGGIGGFALGMVYCSKEHFCPGCGHLLQVGLLTACEGEG